MTRSFPFSLYHFNNFHWFHLLQQRGHYWYTTVTAENWPRDATNTLTLDSLVRNCYTWKVTAGRNSYSDPKADSTRTLKTRQLRRLTKRVSTPTELPNGEIHKYARSNQDERFWRLQFGVSPASSDSSAVGGFVNASARNVVQSTLRRFIRLSQRGVCARCSMLKILFARWRRAHPYIMYRLRNIRTEMWRQHAGQKSVERCMKTEAQFLPPSKLREVSKFSICWFFFM